ncbi:MAG: site-specific DNA-methyltransferase [Rhizobiaceae bacterium]
MARKPKAPKQVESLVHDEASRKNIPTAELQSLAQRIEEGAPSEPITYSRAYPLAEGETRERETDLDPQIVWKGMTITLTKEQIEQIKETGKIEIGEAQLVWRGKDTQDWSDLVVQTPPIYIQEKIHPKAIIDYLKKQTADRREAETEAPDLFADFNGIDTEAKTEFYQHDQHWTNRMILGDSLQVMASLAEREALRGKVQCIFFDPPYGIKFNSNWQVSTRSRDVKDGKLDQITREPEQVKAFRDTWKDGIHSYLTYLRDRMTVMRDMLSESGSIFVQIGDENVHRVRTLMDEVFGENNFVSEIVFRKTTSSTSNLIENVHDIIIWYSKSPNFKFRRLYYFKTKDAGTSAYRQSGDGSSSFTTSDLTSQNPGSRYDVLHQGKYYRPEPGWWKTQEESMYRLQKAGRLAKTKNKVRYVRYLDDFPVFSMSNLWNDTAGEVQKTYVVQTAAEVVKRCILMATDPGDLVMDPTCGSGTTATVAEQWGRRWITMDTSRVSLALARARLMGARYPYYLLADSPEGRAKEQGVSGKIQPDTPMRGDVRQGFVYERAPHIMLKTIANNAEIDVIWEDYQTRLEPLREALNAALSEAWEEWEIPREADKGWAVDATKLHKGWWDQRIKRQQEIDKSIAQKADVEMLYDRPYEDKNKVRVAGPFTVESLSPHRVIPADEDDLSDDLEATEGRRPAPSAEQEFAQMVLENLKSAGVHQAAKDDRIEFTAIDGWPGDRFIAAVGEYNEGNVTRRAGIFIGPEFGTVTRADLIAAAREALDARFDTLIACGFNFEAHTSELGVIVKSGV